MNATTAPQCPGRVAVWDEERLRWECDVCCAAAHLVQDMGVRVPVPYPRLGRYELEHGYLAEPHTALLVVRR